MAFSFSEYPEFSWSLSRDRVFNSCKRRYYCQYYLSHNGWLTTASHAAQLAYRLKQLTNLHCFVGQAIHNIAKDTVLRLVREEPPATQEECTGVVLYQLQQAIDQSQNKMAWIVRPRNTKMLQEFYYGHGISQERLDGIKSQVATCTENLLASKTIDFLRRNNLTIAEIDLSSNYFLVGQTKVFVRVDLLYSFSDRHFILDWKTGKDDVALDQLAIYGLYAVGAYGWPHEHLRFQVESLKKGERLEVDLAEPELALREMKIRQSVAAMQEYLADVEVNKPLPVEAFPVARDERRCVDCNFIEMCCSAAMNKIV